MLDEEFMQ